MPATLSLAYDPPGATLKAFRQSAAMARGLVGPISGGRKTCAVHDILLRAAQGSQRRWRWVAIRAEGTRLDEETIACWHRWVPESLGQWDPKARRHRIGFNIAGKPKDLDIVFLALDRPDDRRRLQSVEASGFWLDGARELDEAVFEQALDLAGSWPLDEKATPAVICTSRMPAEDHWLLRRPELTLFRQPGGRTAQAENLKHLKKPGYYHDLAGSRPAEWVRIQVDAEPGSGHKAGSLADLIQQSYELAEAA